MKKTTHKQYYMHADQMKKEGRNMKGDKLTAQEAYRYIYPSRTKKNRYKYIYGISDFNSLGIVFQ